MPRHQTSRNKHQGSIILLPFAFAFSAAKLVTNFWVNTVIATLLLPITIIAAVTGVPKKDILSLNFFGRKQIQDGSYVSRIRTAASGALQLGDSATETTLAAELERAKYKIDRLEKQLQAAQLEDEELATDLVINDLQHQLQPDRRDEFQVEHKLLTLLKQRVQDTKISEEYKTAAETQALYYNGVIETLRSDLEKELSVIEHQQQDKAVLEKQIQVARDLIERLKTDLAAESKRKEAELEQQKLKYKSDQDRINSEFKTATDFCNDLRRKLESETTHKNSLLEKSNTLATEIQQFSESNREQNVRIKALEKSLQEEKHQLALTKQEKHRDLESNKATITRLEQMIKETNDRVIIVKNKGAEDRAKELQRISKEKDDAISKLEQKIKELHRNADADLKNRMEERKIQLQLIEDLKIKDSDDVSRERSKAQAEIKRITLEHEAELKRLQAQYEHVKTDLENADSLLRVLKAEYDAEKQKVQDLNDEIAKLDADLKMAQSDKTKLTARIDQFSKELELERQSISTKLDLEKESIKQQYDTDQKTIVSDYKQKTDKLTRELDSQKAAAKLSEQRLDETKKELVGRIAELEKEKQEASRRVKEAEQIAKTKEATLKETIKQQEASNQRAKTLAETLASEQQKTAQLQIRLTEQIKTTQKTHAERLDYTKKLEEQVVIAKNLISTLKPQYDTDRERNAELLSEWRAEKSRMDSQVESMKQTLAQEREKLEKEKGKVAQYQTQLRQLDNRNDALQRDAQHNEQAKEVVVTKEVRTTQVQRVETN